MLMPGVKLSLNLFYNKGLGDSELVLVDASSDRHIARMTLFI